MKHLCFVTNELSPLTKGGIGVLLSNVTRDLTEKTNFSLSILIFGNPVSDLAPVLKLYSNSKNIRFYFLDELLAHSGNHSEIPLWAFHHEEYYLSYRICNALLFLNERQSIDILEFNDYLGSGYVTTKLKKLIIDGPFANTLIGVRLHGSAELCQISDEENLYTMRKQIVYQQERYSLENCDFWISPSNSLHDYYAQFYKINKTSFVSTPTFTKLEEQAVHPRKLNLKNPKILFYGKLQKLKGIEEFIQAGVLLLEKSSVNYSFEIFGHEVNYPYFPSYLAHLKKQIPERFQNNFHFHGRISMTELSQIACTCDLAVIPSRFETFCLAAHELNWIGIPLVLNRIDAFQDYFSEENCFYYNGKPTELFACINDIYSKKKTFERKWNGDTITTKLNKGKPELLYTTIAESFTRPLLSETSTPLLSIVVPYYNMEKYIDQTLDSILRSSYGNYEVIVVNDGSNNPASTEKFESLKSTYKGTNFSFVTKENGGLGSARNFGIALAKGKYLLPLDSDDLIHKQYLELAVNALEKNPELVAVNSYVNFFMDGTDAGAIIDYVIPYDLNKSLILIENRAGVACSIFRSDIFKKVKYNEELKAYEDWEFWWKLANLNLKAETLPIILYHYRRRADSMVNQEGIQRHVLNLNQMSALNKEFIAKQSFITFNLLSTLQNDCFLENIRLKKNGNTASSESVSESEHKYAYLKDWYHKEYEVLPLWYKRFGHVIKVVQGNRTIKSLIKKDKI
jgi:glycosyltransferase involved in cell wall biosynthesis